MFILKLLNKIKNYSKLVFCNFLFYKYRGRKRPYKISNWVKDARLVALNIPILHFKYSCKSWKLPIIYIIALFIVIPFFV